MRLTATLLLCLLAAGCTRQARPPEETTETPPPVPTGVMQPPRPQQNQPNPSDVLVEVNGTKITRGQAMLALQRAQAQNPRRRVSIQNAVQMLIANTLLTGEMDSMEIDVTDEEIAAERKLLAEGLPEGKTLEEMMKKDGVSEEYLRRALQQRVRTQKFLTAKGSDPKATDKEFQDYMARHEAAGKQYEEKKKKIDDIRKQLLDGADFAKLAEEHSDCPSGKRAGGDLGKFGRGQMAPEFEKAAFTQKPNEIGPVIETQFGFHIVQVLEKSAAGAKKEGGVPVPEHVRARHILVSAKKQPPTIPDEKVVRSMISARKANMALGKIVQELMAKSDIKYVGMPSPQQPRRPRVQPVRPRPGVKMHTSGPKKIETKTVASQPVAAPQTPRRPPP